MIWLRGVSDVIVTSHNKAAMLC